MTAILAGLWAFANSTLGQTLIIGLIAELFRRGIKDKGRRAKLLEYAGQAFLVAEAIGVREKLGGREKYLRFVETIVNKLKAERAPALAPAEVELLKAIAYEKAWLAKPAPPRP